jgi:uncharacterized protein with NAD-binding domain and iron-sulfur cluster
MPAITSSPATICAPASRAQHLQPASRMLATNQVPHVVSASAALAFSSAHAPKKTITTPQGARVSRRGWKARTLLPPQLSHLSIAAGRASVGARTGGLGGRRVLAGRKHADAHRLAGAVRQHHRAAHLAQRQARSGVRIPIALPWPAEALGSTTAPHIRFQCGHLKNATKVARAGQHHRRAAHLAVAAARVDAQIHRHLQRLVKLGARELLRDQGTRASALTAGWLTSPTDAACCQEQ